jgi:sporulation and spore germination protein
MRPGRSWAALALILTLLFPAGCGGSGNGDGTSVSVYFVRERTIAASRRQVSDNTRLAAAAVEQLLEGTTDDEGDAGLLSALPEETRLLGLTVLKGSAVVDLSAEFGAPAGRLATAQRFAQVVYTLTQFPGVSRVRFEVEGRRVRARGPDGVAFDGPVGRASYEPVTPAVLVETPVVGTECGALFACMGPRTRSRRRSSSISSLRMVAASPRSL